MADLAPVYDKLDIEISQGIPETRLSFDKDSSKISERKLVRYYSTNPATVTLPNEPQSTINSSHHESEKKVERTRPVFSRIRQDNMPTFRALQEWEGMVDEVYSDYFSAIVFDKTRDNPDEYVEFDTEEIDRGDIQLLAPGAIFYWSIGYYTSTYGQRLRTSEIRFRRLPAWSSSDISRAKNKAALLAQGLGFEFEAFS